MTTHQVHVPGPVVHRSFRLSTREVRSTDEPDVVLSTAQAQAVLAAARSQDVSAGGCFSPGPAGVQVWDGPWNGPGGRVGTAQHLGSVDWCWDAPSAGLVTVYRVLLTGPGGQAGLTSHALLDLVLGLAGSGRVPQPRAAAEPLPLNRA